jgi:hypothetical protein
MKPEHGPVMLGKGSVGAGPRREGQEVDFHHEDPRKGWSSPAIARAVTDREPSAEPNGDRSHRRGPGVLSPVVLTSDGMSDAMLNELSARSPPGALRGDRLARSVGYETPGRHPVGFGDGNAVSAAVCRSGDLNNQPEEGKLNPQPKQYPQHDRRRQRAEQAAFQFRRYALPRRLIFEVGGNIRHDIFLSVVCGITASRIYEV